MIIIIKVLLIFVLLALGVGFFTLLERKALSYIQSRKGPNKVSHRGILQPIADAVKLFLKENSKPFHGNLSLFIFSPLLSLTLILTIWMFNPLKEREINSSFSAFVRHSKIARLYSSRSFASCSMYGFFTSSPAAFHMRESIFERSALVAPGFSRFKPALRQLE